LAWGWNACLVYVVLLVSIPSTPNPLQEIKY
jgi:hypothetical protein